ncbi:MAG TPA: TetR/AcrR family transcriptional regulator [Pilimelia sp.]|nr:TetR/AcrR family transcriptional regulator [Pilimelia sp.]
MVNQRGSDPSAPRTSTDKAGATRDRLIDAAMGLFAERGYRNTTVGDIEAKAGLAPRSGALYQYFGSKEDLLRAGIDKRIGQLEEVHSVMDLLPLADLRSEIIMLGRWSQQDFTRREWWHRLVRQEGDLFPGLKDEIREAVHDAPYRQVSRWIRQMAEDAGVTDLDIDVLAMIIVGSMGHFRMVESIYGKKALGIDDARFLDGWVEACLGIFEHYRLDSRGDSARARATRPADEPEDGPGAAA